MIRIITSKAIFVSLRYRETELIAMITFVILALVGMLTVPILFYSINADVSIKPTLDSIKITKSPLDTGTKWRKYNSTLGVSLEHPSNWTVEQQRDPYVILPLVPVFILQCS